jgi:hypothetical protein
MQKELEQIIQEYGLENTRIQRGRRRIHPEREGLNATPQELADLRSVLEGTSVKGFLAVTAGDVVIAANTAGAIEKAFDRSSMPVQAEVFKVDTPVLSKTEAPITESIPEMAMENVEQRSVVMQSRLNRSGVDEKDVLESQINPDDARQSENDLPSKALQDAIEEQTESRRDDYIWLSDVYYNDSMFPGNDYPFLYNKAVENPAEGIETDRHVVLAAFQQKQSPEKLEEALSVSPYVQSQVDQGVPRSEMQEQYIRPMIAEYMKFYQEKIAKGSPEENLLSAVEQAIAPRTTAETSLGAEVNRENDVAKNRYMDLLSQHPRMAGQEIPAPDELLAKAPAEQRQADKLVSEMAAIKGIDPDEHSWILAQGSAYIQSNLDNKKVFEGNPALGLDGNSAKMSEGLDYLSKQSSEFRNAYMGKIHGVAPSAASTKYPSDYPQDAQTLDPTANLKNTIAQGSTTVKESILSATETLALAQKNMATFTKHVKHRGLKAWAKEQMPVLQNKAKQLAQTQAAKIGAYVKDQAPIVRDAVISGAKQVGDTVVQYAKVQAPIVAEKAKAVGEVIHERFTEFTQLVDPIQIEKLGNHVLGNDGGFEGTTFDFKRGQNGIDISLKNGTPVFSDGKLNPKLDTSHAIHLNQMTEKLNSIQLQTEHAKKAIAR